MPAVNFGGIPLVDDTLLAPAIGLTGSVVGVTNAAGQTLAFGPGGTLQPYNTGTATGNPIFASGGDGLRLSTVSNLLSPTERINVDTLMHFQINDHINAFGEGYFSESHATNLIAQPAYTTNLFGQGGTANGNFVVSLNNPYLTPDRSRADPDGAEQLRGDIAFGTQSLSGRDRRAGTAGVVPGME